MFNISQGYDRYRRALEHEIGVFGEILDINTGGKVMALKQQHWGYHITIARGARVFLAKLALENLPEMSTTFS